MKRQNGIRTTPAGRLMKVRITGRVAAEEHGRLPAPLEPARGPGPPRGAGSTGIGPNDRSEAGRPSSRPSTRATSPRGCRACPRARPSQNSSCCSGARNGAVTSAPPNSIVTSDGIGMHADSSSIRTRDGQVAVPGDLSGHEVGEQGEQAGLQGRGGRAIGPDGNETKPSTALRGTGPGTRRGPNGPARAR